jgi:hypothetical protein
MYRPSAEAMSSDCLFSIYQRQKKNSIKKGEHHKLMQRMKTSTKPSHDQNINKYETKLRGLSIVRCEWKKASTWTGG